MRKFLGVAIASLLLATVTFAAPAAKPKATGDADWINSPDSYNQQANTTFNAISTKGDGFLDAKGSVIYTDANIEYTMDVQFLKVVGNKAWFAGQVTSVTGTGCCAVGNWILYKVVDNGEPGTLDEIWGEDLGTASIAVAHNKVASEADPLGGPFGLNGGNIQVH